MNHPPIPPNCPYFALYKHRGCYCFAYKSDEDLNDQWDQIVELDNCGPNFRRIIAAVAEVAWRSEYESIFNANCHRLVYVDWPDEAITASHRCIKNAEAWRLWGRGEWKPDV